jgi:hypothetical protein
MLIDPKKATQLAEFLGYVAEELDIPDEVYQQARQRYAQLGDWLRTDHIERYQSDAKIYHQGSLRLGTAIRPVKKEDDHDVDLVYRRDIQKESTTQEELKVDLGQQLQRYIQYLRHNGKAVPELVPGRRCWILDYKGQFHMDVLPALPDDEAAKYNMQDLDDAIIITDTKLLKWQHSNPKGYANWFNDQQEMQLMEQREMMAKAAEVDVDTIPRERVPTPLRRAIQILKRHRDIQYEGNPDDKPISIIITTLAAKAYGSQPDIFEALTAISTGMHDGIKTKNGEYWVPNPINPEENFADKWKKGEEPQRAERFFKWLSQVEEDFSTASQQIGLHKIAESLAPVLGEDTVNRALKQYGGAMDRRQQQGQLRMAAKSGMLGTVGTVIKKNTWYGA